MIVLWQWSTPSRLTPATSLPSLLVRHSGRKSLMVRSVISWYLAWSGDLVFHWKLVNCCPSVHRCRVLPLSGICGDLGGTLGGEMFGPSGRLILFKLSQNESGGTAYNTACSFFYWVHCGRSSCFLIIVLFTDIQMLNTPFFVCFFPHLLALNTLQHIPTSGIPWEPVILSVWWCQRGGPVLHPGCPGGSCHASAQWVACSSASPGPGYSKQGGSLTIRWTNFNVGTSGKTVDFKLKGF